MPYCAQDDVQHAAGGLKKLKELVDWDNDGTADAVEVTAAIANADALIDSFCAGRFSVPFNPVPSTIRRCSAELARIMLARDRNVMTDALQQRWEEIAGTDDRKPGWLLLLAKGVVTPGTDPQPAKHSTMAVDSVETTLPAERDTSRDKTSGFW